MKNQRNIICSALIFLFVLFFSTACDGMYEIPSGDGDVDLTGLTAIWTGTHNLDWNDSGAVFTLDASEFADVPNGSPLTIIANGGFMWAAVDSGFVKFNAFMNHPDANGDGFVTLSRMDFNLNGAEWASVKSTGMQIFGEPNAVISGVYFGASDNSGENSTATLPWTGSLRTGAGADGTLAVASSCFPGDSPTEDGASKLIISYTTGSDADVDSTVIVKSGAPAYMNRGNIVEAAVSAAGDYTFTLTPADVMEFSTYGIVVTGYDITVTQVVFSSLVLDLRIVTSVPAGADVLDTFTTYNDPNWIVATVPFTPAANWFAFVNEEVNMGDAVYVTMAPLSANTQIVIKNSAWGDIGAVTGAAGDTVFAFNVIAALDGYIMLSGEIYTINSIHVVRAD